MNNSVTNIKIISSLEKIYHGDSTPKNELKSFSMLKNEKKSFQMAIESTCDISVNLAVNTDIKKVYAYTVEHVKSSYPMNEKGVDDYYRFSKDGYYPDLLLPCDKEVFLKKGVNVFWIEIDADGSDIGKHTINVSVSDVAKQLEVEIINAELDFKNFIYTCWFHSDCLASYYKIDVFSDEYWRITENFLKTACTYGMNCVLTPIFTPPLDTEVGGERPTVQLVDINVNNGKYLFNFDKLTQWIDMAHRCGVEYFELAHFYTQWGARHAPKIMATVDGEYKRIFGWETKADSAEYKKFLKALSDELKAYFEKSRLKDKVLIHVSDEPSIGVMFKYRKASRWIHKLFNGYKIIDALSDPWFYKLRIVSNPIPSTDHIDKFLGKVNNLWAYYCSGQNNHYVSNRFFCNESLRTRVIGYQLFKYDIVGFLHWGYNFYFTQLSKKLIDPYLVTDAGGKFPSGDSFVVYPAKDGTANQSIRLKVFYDALQDMAALNALASLAGKKECMDIIEENGKHNLTFKEYPHEEDWLLNTREEINKRIKDIVK